MSTSKRPAPKRGQLVATAQKNQRPKDLISARVSRFYAKYAPEKLTQLEFLLPLFLMDEDAAFAQVISKYGPEPLAEGTKERISALYEYYDPEKLVELDHHLLLAAGKDEEFVESIVKTYGPEPKQPQFRARIERFYACHAPNRLQDLGRILPMIVGTEEETMQKLIRKYGPEPVLSTVSDTELLTNETLPVNADTGSAPQGASSELIVTEESPTSETRDRLIRFYTHYAPEKLEGVDRIFSQMVGFEEDTFAKLIAKYGPELLAQDKAPSWQSIVSPGKHLDEPPLVRKGTRERLIRFYTVHAPAKLEDVDRLLPMLAGFEDETFAKLVLKYGPEPPCDEMAITPGAEPAEAAELQISDATPATEPQFSEPEELELQEGTRDRLVRFYEAHCPAKLADIDRLLPMIAGNESATFEKLVAKYGAEPLIQDTVERTTDATLELQTQNAALVTLADGIAPQLREGTRDRLVRFYSLHAPAKLAEVDRLLPMIAGFEDETFSKLVSKYGPEPGTNLQSPTSKTSPALVAEDVFARDLDNGAALYDRRADSNESDNAHGVALSPEPVITGDAIVTTDPLAPFQSDTQPRDAVPALSTSRSGSTVSHDTMSLQPAALSAATSHLLVELDIDGDDVPSQDSQIDERIMERDKMNSTRAPSDVLSGVNSGQSLASKSQFDIDAIDGEWRSFIARLNQRQTKPVHHRIHSHTTRRSTSRTPTTTDSSEACCSTSRDELQLPQLNKLAALVFQRVGRAFLTRRFCIDRECLNMQAKFEHQRDSRCRRFRSAVTEVHTEAEKAVARMTRRMISEKNDHARRERREVVHWRQCRHLSASASWEASLKDVERQALIQQKAVEDLARHRRQQQAFQAELQQTQSSFGGRKHVEDILMRHDHYMKRAALDLTLDVVGVSRSPDKAMQRFL
jgi:hypothetical protein